MSGGFDNPIPQLLPPEGAQTLGGFGGGGGNDWRAAAILHSAFTNASLADHYARQLESADWKRVGRTSGEVEVDTFEFRDEAGDEWWGQLIVSGLPADEEGPRQMTTLWVFNLTLSER